MNVRPLLFASFLLVAPGLPSAAVAAEPLEDLVVKMANTPEEHAALAGYFHEKAEAARKEATHHRSMGKTYASGKLTEREQMKGHCEKIASEQESLAKEYEALAALHDAEAKKK